MVVKSDGSVYFSDPTYGRMPGFGLERDQELGFQGVFRIAPDGELHCEADDFGQPNGLCFSPDESILYVNDTTHAHIRVFDVGADGSLGNGQVFAENIGDGSMAGGLVDGMKCDGQGNVYVTGPRGFWVFAPGWRAPRRHRDAGALGEPQLGRRRVERVVLHLFDIDLQGRAQGRRQSPGLHVGRVSRLSKDSVERFFDRP